MAYDNPLVISYTYDDVDIGAGDATVTVIDQPGLTGRVVEIHASASETFTDTTTEGYIRIGDGSDADKFGELAMGTTASGASLSALGDAANQTVGITETEIATDDALTVTVVAPTGGTPAGIADITIVVEWY